MQVSEKKYHLDEAQALQHESMPVRQAKIGVRGLDTRKSWHLPHNSGLELFSRLLTMNNSLVGCWFSVGEDMFFLIYNRDI